MTDQPQAELLTSKVEGAKDGAGSLNCPNCGVWLAGRVGIRDGTLTLYCRHCRKRWDWRFSGGLMRVVEAPRPPRPGEAAPPRGTG